MRRRKGGKKKNREEGEREGKFMTVAARREALTGSVNVGHGQRRMIDAAAIGLREHFYSVRRFNAF